MQLSVRMPSMKREVPVVVSEQLRLAIETAEISQYELARRIDLDKSVLSRFLHGKSGLSVQSIDAICQELGLELKKKRPLKEKG